MASSDSQIDKPQHGRPKRTGLPDVNINTGVQSINIERTSFPLSVNKSHTVFVVCTLIVTDKIWNNERRESPHSFGHL